MKPIRFPVPGPRFLHAVPLVALALALFGLGSAPDLSIWWSPRLDVRSLKDVPSALKEPVSRPNLPPLTLRKGAESIVPLSCAAYLEARSEGFRPSTSGDSNFEYPFVERCFVLQHLLTAKPASRSYLPSAGWTGMSLDDLPPIGIAVERPNGERQKRILEAGGSWKSFEPDAKIINRADTAANPDDLQIDGGWMAYSLTIVGRADFNGDGLEDIAVCLGAHATAGTLGYSQFYILTRYKEGQTLRLVSGPDK